MISVIIPLYNKQECIVHTLLSVINQKSKEGFEIIVVNDGSTDFGVDYVRNLHCNRIRILDKVNGGPSSARNYGVNYSLGEWILFLDADDTLCEGAILHFEKLIANNKHIKCFCCNFYYDYGNYKSIFSLHYSNGVVDNPFKEWLYLNFLPRTGASLFHKSVVQRFPYKNYLRRFEDAESLFEIMRTETFFRSSKPVMNYNRRYLAASSCRNDISEDFLGHLSLERKGFWEQVVLYSMYRKACIEYPDQARKLYNSSSFSKPDVIAAYKRSCEYVLRKRKCDKYYRWCEAKIGRLVTVICSHLLINGSFSDSLKSICDPRTCKIHRGSYFEGCNKIGHNTIFDGVIGFGSYIGPNSIFYGTIGRFTSIGPELHVNLGTHPLQDNFATTSPMFYSTLNQCGSHFCTSQQFKELLPGISIGNDCWIGERVFIAGGVKIGDGAVILSCAAVVKDVPAYAIVGGVPARILRYRYDEDTINKFVRLEWWNKDIAWLQSNWMVFNQKERLLELLEKNEDSSTSI